MSVPKSNYPKSFQALDGVKPNSIIKSDDENGRIGLLDSLQRFVGLCGDWGSDAADVPLVKTPRIKGIPVYVGTATVDDMGAESIYDLLVPLALEPTLGDMLVLQLREKNGKAGVNLRFTKPPAPLPSSSPAPTAPSPAAPSPSPAPVADPAPSPAPAIPPKLFPLLKDMVPISKDKLQADQMVLVICDGDRFQLLG